MCLVQGPYARWLWHCNELTLAKNGDHRAFEDLCQRLPLCVFHYLNLLPALVWDCLATYLNISSLMPLSSVIKPDAPQICGSRSHIFRYNEKLWVLVFKYSKGSNVLILESKPNFIIFGSILVQIVNKNWSLAFSKQKCKILTRVESFRTSLAIHTIAFISRSLRVWTIL